MVGRLGCPARTAGCRQLPLGGKKLRLNPAHLLRAGGRFVVLPAIENSKKDIGVNRVNKLSLG
jgi:hypothetical protein